MAQFISFDPQVEVLGVGIQSSIAAMGERVKPILAKYGLDSVQPEEWYPLQDWLNVFKEVAGEGSGDALADLVSIGMRVPETALFPPEINSITTALQAIDVAYHMNHRNGEIGHYTAKVVGEQAIDLICDNPFPCDFDYGIIYGMARRFRPEGMTFTVEHDEASCRKDGADVCTYHVTWE